MSCAGSSSAALWLDVDDDGAISGLDQPMATHTAVAALEVCTEPVPVGDSLRLVPIAADAIELTWDASPNATSFTVYRSTIPTSGWTPVGSTPSTTQVDTTATAPLLYYKVSSSNACGESSF